MLNGHFSNNWAGCLSHDYNSVACFQVEAQLILEIRNHSLACLDEILNCSFASDSSPCLVRKPEMTLPGISSSSQLRCFTDYFPSAIQGSGFHV